MIRLVRVGYQIEKGKDQFAFYDTVSNTFILFVSYEMQVFDSIISFEEVAPHNHPHYERCRWLLGEAKGKDPL